MTWTRIKSGTWRGACAVAVFLWQDRIPLVITIIASIAGTLWIAPGINERFERQKMQATYVLENLREFNKLISDVYVDVTVINHTVASGKLAPAEKVTSARESLVRLNWKLIETASILSRDEDKELLRDFQVSVSGVMSALNGKLDIKGCKILLLKVNEMALHGSKVIATIGKQADLSSKASD